MIDALEVNLYESIKTKSIRCHQVSPYETNVNLISSKLSKAFNEHRHDIVTDGLSDVPAINLMSITAYVYEKAQSLTLPAKPETQDSVKCYET